MRTLTVIYHESNTSTYLDQSGNHALNNDVARGGARINPAELSTSSAALLQEFSSLFPGRENTLGISSGDAARTDTQTLTAAHYRRHLGPDGVSGDWSLGLNPLRIDNTILFAVLDFDAKDLTELEAREIIQRARDLALPLVWTRSKSNGLHGWLFFSEPVDPAMVRQLLKLWGNALGWSEKSTGGSKQRGARFFEVFPKQEFLDQDKNGNWIRLPWPGGNDAKSRRGIDLNPVAPSFREWIAAGLSSRLSKQRLAQLAQNAPLLAPAVATSKTGDAQNASPRLEALSAPPEPEFTIAHARVLLDKLSQERRDDYDSWTHVLMALHHQFAGTDDEAEAISLLTDWSSTSAKYKSGDVEMKWRSFRSRGDGNTITVRSLRHWAETDSPIESEKNAIARLNQNHAYVLKGGGAILYTPTSGDPDFLDARRFKEFYGNQSVLVDGKLRKLGSLWIQHPDRRSYHTVVFDPKAAPLSGVPSRLGPKEAEDYNLWPGLGLTPSREGSCDLFLAHVKHVVCEGNEQLNNWVLQWLADIVQHPGEPVGTALALQGPQGSGKTLVGEIMGDIVGHRLYTKTSRPEELTGRFNGHQEGRLLIQVEEGFWAGDNRAAGALKNMITSPTVRIERKFMDPLEIPNYARLLITSNSSWIVPAGMSERRFAVLDVSGTHANDIEYFAALRRQMFDQGGNARLLDLLLNEVKVDRDVIRRPPQTQALLEQQMRSLEPPDRWLVDLLRNGKLPGDLEGKGRTDRVALQASFEASMRFGNRSWEATPQRLGRLLKDRLKQLVSDHRSREAGGARQWEYQFAPLSECRAQMSRQFGSPIEWDGPEEWQPDDTPRFGL